MKDSDYIVTLAPMKTKLKLKGQALDLFALIYGYSKDGESTCRASLTYLAEWLDTDRHAVSKLIKRLVDAGYINRIEYLRGEMKCYEYTTNYGAMLAKAERGEKMGLPTAKSVVKNTTVVKNTPKCCKNDNESVVKTTTNNLDNIYNIIFFNSATSTQQEEEKKNFFKSFFFRNAADPADEVRRFVAFNSSRDWKTENGIVYDTPAKRLALADLWDFKGGRDRCKVEFLNAIECLYSKAVEAGIENADALLDQRMTFTFDGKETVWKLTLGAAARQWMNENIELTREHILPLAKGWNVKYVTC